MRYYCLIAFVKSLTNKSLLYGTSYIILSNLVYHNMTAF
nr:MAG TPA: hypothetical protein [Caudoviricetes sp.]